MQPIAYPVTLSVDYPDRELDRRRTALRIFVAIPILILLASVGGSIWIWPFDDASNGLASAGGMLVLGPAFMIVFRQRYPRWWFDWNLQMQRFTNRVIAFLALMDDRYPSTEEEQSVHLDYPYPDVEKDLIRWMPLVKWILAIPHFVVLFFLNIATVFIVVFVWFKILSEGTYPRQQFDFVEGVMRWNNRVIGYALIMVTDQYPPFSLSA